MRRQRSQPPQSRIDQLSLQMRTKGFEALQLLELVKPLLRKTAPMTSAELEILEKALRETSNVAFEATDGYWQWRSDKNKEETAVAPLYQQ